MESNHVIQPPVSFLDCLLMLCESQLSPYIYLLACAIPHPTRKMYTDSYFRAKRLWPLAKLGQWSIDKCRTRERNCRLCWRNNLRAALEEVLISDTEQKEDPYPLSTLPPNVCLRLNYMSGVLIMDPTSYVFSPSTYSGHHKSKKSLLNL